jgi:CO/xanthine dehydrogenase Mo-binding subunit
VNTASMSRRRLLSAGGLVVAFSISSRVWPQGAGGASKTKAAELPGSLKTTPLLDSWIRVDGEGKIVVFTGKAELGQGIKTALVQVAADELDVPAARITLITADTARTPNEGVTAGSHSMQDSGTAILNAAANVRGLLTSAAAGRWNLAASKITTTGEGAVRAPDGRTLSYGDLAASLDLHVAATPDAPRHTSTTNRLIGADLPRVDIPAKLTGGSAYVHDLRLPGMLHARVVRGPSFGTRLRGGDIEAVSAMPGIVKVVRRGAFTAIVAEAEWPAILALRRLQAAGWDRAAAALPPADPLAALRASPTQDIIVANVGGAAPAAGRRVEARYTRPWLMNGAIGPSCAVALFDGGMMTVWTHSQGVFPLRRALAELLGMAPEKVRCIQSEGSGCYGHNGADDVAADAALAALAVPGRPVRLQWMREQEHGWEPLGPGMVVEASATLGADGRIADWRYDVWSNAHNGRPVTAGGLLAGAEVEPPFPPRLPGQSRCRRAAATATASRSTI